MALGAKAWTAIVVAVVVLSLTMLPNWSMAFLILLGMIASAVNRAVEMMKTEPILPVYAPAPRADARVDALALSVDAPVEAPALAVDALALSVDALVHALVHAPALSVDAPVHAPALAVDALALSVDARVDAPALSVDALALSVDAPVDAPALSVNASALAVDAPALAVDAPVDAPPLATAVVATATGIKMRRKPESSSISSSSSPRFKYDVYLSSSGSDTRYGITDHLYAQLVDAGIRVFRNEGELLKGKEIWPALKEAIRRSRISIPILSGNCASIKSCLNELVQMWECMKLNGQTIFPILYEVTPADVRYQQAGDFGRSFNSREIDRVNSNTNKTWKEVLRQIGKISGYFGDKREGPESLLVKEVVARVVRVLTKDCQVVTDKLVGIDLHVEEMMRTLGVAYSEGQAIEVRGEEVRVVAICGVLGVGKTTLAKVVFNKMHKLFDARSFLENVRSEGVQFSRSKLIVDLKRQLGAPLGSSSEEIEEIASLCRDAKVLIVLDGVDKEEQIKALAGKLTWFGPGSRIIVTTNKRDVLKAFDVAAVEAVEEHTVKPMDQGHAHKLFCKHAFEGDAAQDVSEYFSLSTSIAKAIGGLPSDIVRQASSLREDMNMVRWKTTLELLQQKHKK